MSTSSAEERYDPLLLNIASNVHGIEELLDVFLGFLRRKSDAFNPPGGYSQLEEAFVASLKRQWDLGQAAKAKAKAAAAAQSRPAAAAASAASTATNKKAVPTSSQQVATPKPMSPVDDVLELTPDGFDASRTVTTAAATSIESTAEPQRTTQTTIPPPGGAVVAADTDSQAATASPLGNGGTTDRYSWTQTLGDVTVVFDVPPSTRSRDVVVDISTKRVKVALRGASSSLLEGALPKRIKAEDSFWTLGKASGSGRAAPCSMVVACDVWRAQSFLHIH